MVKDRLAANGDGTKPRNTHFIVLTRKLGPIAPEELQRRQPLHANVCLTQTSGALSTFTGTGAHNHEPCSDGTARTSSLNARTLDTAPGSGTGKSQITALRRALP